jgi:hypothetical protein
MFLSTSWNKIMRNFLVVYFVFQFNIMEMLLLLTIVIITLLLLSNDDDYYLHFPLQIISNSKCM